MTDLLSTTTMISQAVSAMVSTAIVGGTLFRMMLTRLDAAEEKIETRHDRTAELANKQFQDLRASIQANGQEIARLVDRVGVQNGRVTKAENRLDEIDTRTRAFFENPPYYRKEELYPILQQNIKDVREAVIDAMESLERKRAERGL